MDYSCVDVLYVLILMLLRLLSGISIRCVAFSIPSSTTTFSALRSQTEWINQWQKKDESEREENAEKKERENIRIGNERKSLRHTQRKKLAIAKAIHVSFCCGKERAKSEHTIKSKIFFSFTNRRSTQTTNGKRIKRVRTFTEFSNHVA